MLVLIQEIASFLAMTCFWMDVALPQTAVAAPRGSKLFFLDLKERPKEVPFRALEKKL
jgi:hypothetical protein